MKNLIPTLALLISVLSNAFATTTTSAKPTSETATYKLTVTITQVNKRTGKLYVGLATDEATFKGTSAETKAVDVPPSGEITVTFDNLPEGRYAVRVYQDLNDNKKMDFSGQMPTEPFGFSNVAMLMGPPNFDQSSFDLNESKAVKIIMMEM